MMVWDEIGPDCFRRRYDVLDLNVGVVRGADAVCVFDTRCHDAEARELLDDLGQLGRSRVQWIVNSHWHFDHVFGNAELLRRHPDVEIWGHRQMHAELMAYGELGRDLAKELLPDAVGDLDAVEIVPPNRLMDEFARLDLGGRVLELHHLGRGHTGGDLVAFVPDSDVLFAGDLVEESAAPGINADSHLLEWSDTDGRMLELIGAATCVVPGHGDIVDREFVTAQRDALDRLSGRIRELHRDGVPADAAVRDLATSSPWPDGMLEAAVETTFAVLDAAPEGDRS